MATKSNRIFVGNLPHEVTREDILRKFKQYGNVESVEIKTKNDTSSGQVLATFSYVNLSTDNDTLANCEYLPHISSIVSCYLLFYFILYLSLYQQASFY